MVFSDAILWRHNKSNMADGRHVESLFLAISPRFIVRLTWNLVRRSAITFTHRTCDQINNFRKFKMADSRHFENSFIAISQPRIIRFQLKFGVLLQILVLRTVIWHSILKIQDGGRPPFWKWFINISQPGIIRFR